MRQSGILAAAGLYALEHNINRLAEDHRHAREMAEIINQVSSRQLGLTAITQWSMYDFLRAGRESSW